MLDRTLKVVGDRWTLPIVRDAPRGVRRFEDFRTRLGVTHNVLANRLSRLTDAGILERRLYQRRPDRHEYHVTRRGVDLWPVVMCLLMRGDRLTKDVVRRFADMGQYDHNTNRNP